MYDLVVRGGQIVDGTGTPAYTGDIGITDGRVVVVGRAEEGARQTIDADGALVTPGWVDPHTHYDGQVTWDDQLEGSVANGVTTVVMGNCGVGFAPVPNGGADALIDLMEGVEDIPGTALHEGIPWGAWESYPEYLEYLDRRTWTIDVASQLPHGALRFYVMGERAVTDADATSEELERMSRLVTGAVRAGAVGFSTSRIQGHRSMSGYCVPGTFAPEAELQAIASAIAAGGGAVFQAIPASSAGQIDGSPEVAGLIDEIGLFGRISRDTGLPFTFTTAQLRSAPDGWRDVLRTSRAENVNGARLHPMVAPRAVSVLTTLRAYHVFMRRPSFLALAGRPHDELVAELRRPEVKARILSERDVPDAARPGAMENLMPERFAAALDRIFPMRSPIDYEPTFDQSLGARAAASGRDPLDFTYDFLLEDDGHSVAVLFGSNYANGDLDACREMLLDPWTVSGLSDAGAHVTFICDMSAQTFHLTHWARDRSRGERLPIEHVVAKITSGPAKLYGLTDRGTLEVGKRADLNVIDFDKLAIQMPALRHDLPAGGARFVQPATGYLATVVAGEAVRRLDADTGARPGRLARPASYSVR